MWRQQVQIAKWVGMGAQGWELIAWNHKLESEIYLLVGVLNGFV